MNSAMDFQEECLICSEKLKKPVDLEEEIILYKCDHVFHLFCLLRWALEVHMKHEPKPFVETPEEERVHCPKCRTPLTVHDYIEMGLVAYTPVDGYFVPCWVRAPAEDP